MTAHGHKEVSGTADDMAAFWAVRLTSADCTPEDRFAFEKWKRADPAHVEAFERTRRMGAFVDNHMTDPVIQDLVDDAREAVKPSFWDRHCRHLAAAAACLVVGVALAMFVSQTVFGPPVQHFTSTTETYETAVGERSTITLSDGSVITLNTNTQIEVDYSEAARDIRLTKGQGYFEVAKELDRPFVVEAGGKRVTALGTAFDVRLDGDAEVAVILVEGQVEIDEPVPTIERELKSGAVERPTKIRLRPGQKLVAGADTVPKVAPTNVDEATSWRTGRLIFRDRPIVEAIAEMNRYNTQKLVLSKDDRIESMVVSGVFNTGRASTFVIALETMHPLKAERTGRNELTLVWQE